ncbi:uracil-DNA glycosylase [Tepidicella xavieri]|uniref:Type-4 uracil-DNA glycosylase n=1 Tax=Tepidicella xavieri TaxID=360241 RepID=A0A4R6UGF4_9BURK|nr:uracil-DNA glycosylase [Tepidicella xavieri]TDQ44339.1 DNA polymerase [Tepidicella xavieri]
MSAAPILAPSVPRLSPRQRAMLVEMGVPVWWPADSEPTSPPAAAQAATRAMPEAPTRPEAKPVDAPPPPRVPHGPPGVPAAQAAAPVTPGGTEHPAPLLPDLPSLEACVHDCRRCVLGQRRQRAVPGMGDAQPDWLIVGEAPGEEEDRQGLPFVGRAGQLLDRMLAAIGLARGHKVYIANIIKCRPPLNRNPDPAEIAQCSPYLLRQIALLRPRLIVAMGRFAAQTLLAEGGTLPPETARQMPLGKLRGQVHRASLGGLELPVIVTYHPAYLLRSPAEKAKAWADLCLALETFDALPAPFSKP